MQVSLTEKADHWLKWSFRVVSECDRDRLPANPGHSSPVRLADQTIQSQGFMPSTIVGTLLRDAWSAAARRVGSWPASRGWRRCLALCLGASLLGLASAQSFEPIAAPATAKLLPAMQVSIVRDASPEASVQEVQTRSVDVVHLPWLRDQACRR